MKMRIWLPVAAILFLSACGSKPTEKGTDLAKANTTYQNELMELLMDAKPGAVIEIPAGVFAIDTELSLVVDGVTIRGQGMDKTILNFRNQAAGAQPLRCQCSGRGAQQEHQADREYDFRAAHSLATGIRY